MDPLTWLFGLEHFGIKLGLDTTTALLSRLRNPHLSFTAVHIAGTNGKGSVTAMVDQMLREAGHRSARYTSPHLVHITERFVIDGQVVSEADLTQTVARVRDTVAAMQADGTLTVTPTFFEVTTAVAFELFSKARVKVAVCETGLGGRLDATNVLQPVATAITTVDLDHQQHLGDTIPEIAREKAGIVKPGVPVVIGSLPDEARREVESIAAARKAPVVEAVKGTQVATSGGRSSFRSVRRDYGAIRLRLAGRHQIHNAQVAIAIAEVLDQWGLPVPVDATVHGLERVEWPGRLEWRRRADGREALLDAAHNPQGAAALADYLQTMDVRLPLVFGAMADKDAAGILRILWPRVSQIVCTRATTARAAEPAALAAIVQGLAPRCPVTIAATVDEALDLAWRRSPRIVVAGSIFLLGDVYTLLQ
jgi:dihydrofolate synthase/folylpolyglutamate synthase